MSDDPYKAPGSPVGRGALLTRGAIVEELCSVWRDALGTSVETVAGTDGNIIEWFQSLGVWEGIDLADFYFPIKRHFGVRVPLNSYISFFNGEGVHDDWDRFVKPKLAFGRFADWIAQNSAPR